MKERKKLPGKESTHAGVRSQQLLRGKNLREEVHGVGVLLDALLPVLGEVSQHLQRPDADGDVVPLRPDLYGNQHHARV